MCAHFINIIPLWRTKSKWGATIYSNNCREREIIERHEATGFDLKIDLRLLSKDRRIETGGFLEREREILSAVEALKPTICISGARSKIWCARA